ncbi:MAG: cytochrome c biogenesis protein CcsA [Lewinellaceae bacterium]|nr:cytochrome c biogenesis protein CcsA [Lewinellaceae bacterium]
MEEIQYVGEHLWPGRIGHFAILTAFVAALLAAFAYFKATQRRETPTEYTGWRSLGRGAFITHGAAVFTAIGVIFYIMINRFFEYQYVWAHVSEELPFKYIFAAFWEGQEGSFLLWMFWHVILGFVLLRFGRSWETSTLAVVALVEAVISSMIVGIYFGGGEGAFKLGSSPLMMLRETMAAPIFANAEYVKLIKGNGLNPLLQNYWMTIHPPTLFLGFASTTIPFAFAIAGLWMRRHEDWLRPALSWALFSGAILGTGILMGGAWAYEALSFGGYWAWDPVENMSLVPWLVLIGGIHTNLVARSTGHSIRSTYLFYILSFVLVVYSTFLTRSGVLGETSVHAFTEMGLEWQLVAFIAIFLLMGGILLGARYKGIPAPAKEEATSSKEFWMFIGSLVLFFSAILITGSTSLPVYNKIMQFFDPTFQGRVIADPIPHYNKYQLWIGVFIGLLSGMGQYLRFREVNWAKNRGRFAAHLGGAAAVAMILTFLTTQWIEAKAWQYWTLLFAGIFTVITNLDYLVSFLRGNLKAGGSVMSHMGFGIMIVGIMASGLNQRVISNNPFIMEGLIEGADDESLRRNILLFKDNPMIMSGYEVTYTDDTLDVYTRTYTVNFKRKDAEGKILEEFDLHPNVLYDKSFTKIAASNPSTKHYLKKDIFTHIASLPQVEIDMEMRQQREDSLNYKVHEVLPYSTETFLDTVELRDQDTSLVKTYSLTLEEIIRNPTHPDYHPEAGDLAVGARIRVHRDDEDSTYTVEPMVALRGQLLYSYPVQINELSTRVRLNEEVFERVFTMEEELNYQEFNLAPGQQTTFGGNTITFQGFNRNPQHSNYIPEEGDLAVGASMLVQTPDGSQYPVEPIFLIRQGQPLNIKSEIEELGIHVRFPVLDPKTEQAKLLLAMAAPREAAIPIDVATDSLRSDYIVLEAIEFPGINFFWLGSIMMMLGMAVSMGYRMSQKRPA